MTSSHRPRIAIAPCNALKLSDYMESVRLAGGDPWVLDPSRDRASNVLDHAAGLLLTGGGDVHPSRYSTAPHPAFGAAEPGRDEFELELAGRSLETEIPLFAICRGVQVINVARGGTLFQHLPDEAPSPTAHEVRDSPTTLAHDVSVAAGSLLGRLLRVLESETFSVNSRHHQAARIVGGGLVVTATAPDGVIEALEDPARSFWLGVQWHPENFWRTGRFQPLFDAFVAAAK